MANSRQRSAYDPDTRFQPSRFRPLELPLQRDQIEVDRRQVDESHLVAVPGAQGRDTLEVAAAGRTGLDFAGFPILLRDERGARLVTDRTAVGTADTGLHPIAPTAGAA